MAANSSARAGWARTVVLARRVAHLAEVTPVTGPDGTSAVCRVTGALFLASSTDLPCPVALATHPGKAGIDLSAAHIRDASSAAAPGPIGTKHARRGKTAEITGLNEAGARMRGTLSGELTGSHRAGGTGRSTRACSGRPSRGCRPAAGAAGEGDEGGG
ncbi:hypothetical protein ABZ299_34330, partial [Streptomyces sp. NPDC006184]